MDQKGVRSLLNQVAEGKVTVEDAVLKLKEAPFEDLGFAKIDSHRALRQGVAEVIYGAGKTQEQIWKIAQAMLSKGQKSILITRMSEGAAKFVNQKICLHYDPISKIGVIGEIPEADGVGTIVVASGGTSDMPVAQEAAGLHRLLAHIDDIMSARVIIAVAGMEGALASVIGGLADSPVIAVPTSVGYGANFGGLSALLSMLNSCASGVSVVNIDNGFGAGYLASMINHMEG